MVWLQHFYLVNIMYTTNGKGHSKSVRVHVANCYVHVASFATLLAEALEYEIMGYEYLSLLANWGSGLYEYRLPELLLRVEEQNG